VHNVLRFVNNVSYLFRAKVQKPLSPMLYEKVTIRLCHRVSYICLNSMSAGCTVFGCIWQTNLCKNFWQQFFSGPRYVVNPYCLLSDELRMNLQYLWGLCRLQINLYNSSTVLFEFFTSFEVKNYNKIEYSQTFPAVFPFRG